MLPDNRETRAIGLGMVILAVFGVVTLSTGLVNIPDFLRLWGKYVLGAFSLWYVIGLGAALCVTVMGGREADLKVGPVKLLMDQLRERWARDRILSLVWPPLLLATLMATFNSFKQFVLVQAGFRFDAAFANIDRALFFGADPWTITHSIFTSADATRAIDFIYSAWIIPMAAGVIACAWLPESSYRIRTQYLFSFMGVWIIMGAMVAFLVPATGPVFVPMLVDPTSQFRDLTQLLATQDAFLGANGLTTLDHAATLIAARDADGLIPGGGISAMPSIHNAISMLFALAAFKVSRIAGWVCAGFAVVIWVGSIHLGWHYAIDGLFALPMTIMIWRGAGRLVEWLENWQPKPADRVGEATLA